MKKIILVVLLIVRPIYKAGVSKVPIGYKGHIYIDELSTKLLLNVNSYQIHSFAEVTYSLYRNGSLYSSGSLLSPDLADYNFEIDGFSYAGEIIDLKLILNYKKTSVANSTLSLSLKGPEYLTYTMSRPYISTSVFVVGKTFDVCGNNCSVSNVSEYIFVSYPRIINLNKTRFLDLSQIYLSVYGPSKKCPSTGELRLYEKFEDSDLLYKSNYTSIDFETSQDNLTIKPINDYRFYLDRKGMIQESAHENTYKDLLPLFIPISKQNTIEYDFIFSGFGLSQTTIVFHGIINCLMDESFFKTSFASCLNYNYKMINENLKGVRYA